MNKQNWGINLHIYNFEVVKLSKDFQLTVPMQIEEIVRRSFIA